MATYTLHVYAVPRSNPGIVAAPKPVYVDAWSVEGATLMDARHKARAAVASHGRVMRSLSFSVKPNEMIAYVEE